MIKYHLFYYKLVNHKIKKITSFNLFRVHLQKKMILQMFIPTHTEYFTVKFRQERYLTLVIATNFMC